MKPNPKPSRVPARPPEPARTREAAVDEIDLEAIDALLAKGAGAVAEPEADPLSGIKAPAMRRPPAEKKLGPAPAETPLPESTTAATVAIPKGALRVEVSPDRLKAELFVKPGPAKGLTFGDVSKALREAGVVHGVNQDGLIELVEAVPEATRPELSVVAAEGTAPAAGRSAEVTCPALGEDALSGPKGIGLQAAGRKLRELLDASRVEETPEACAGLPLVRAGEVVVRIVPAEPGVPGLDVFNKEIPVKPVSEDVPAAGEGVKASEDGTALVSRAFGYLCLDEAAVSVVSPIRVSQDGMKAYLLDLSPSQTPLSADEVIRTMKEKGIAPLPAPEWLAAQLAQGEGRPRALVVAVGSTPQPGQDAKLEMRVEVGSQAGKIMEDGSVDFRQRNFAVNVEKDALLAVKLPLTAGEAGSTVFGGRIETVAGKDLILNAGKGVEAVQAEGKTFYYSRLEGCVHLKNGTLEVGPELTVSGDVDFSTGNIDFKGDLVIGGNVREGFSVKATGDVTIGGGLEVGAQVSSGKSVTVSKGVFGEETRVVALGGIRAQFVQDAALMCRGDVEVGSYIYNASVRSGGSVTVLGRGSRGGIVGGEVCARQHVQTVSAGSEYGTNTRLLAGIDVELMRSHQKVQQALEACRGNAGKIMAVLRVSSPDPAGIGKAMAGLPPAQREKMRLLGRKLTELTEMEGKLEQERKDLVESMRALRGAAQIHVTGTVYQKVDLFLGRAHMGMTDAMKAVTFRLSETEEVEAVPLRAQRTEAGESVPPEK